MTTRMAIYERQVRAALSLWANHVQQIADGVVPHQKSA
jgi:hypothetical protein